MRYLSTKSVLWTILFMWEFSLLNNPQKSQNTATCNGPMKIQPFILRLNTNKVQPIYNLNSICLPHCFWSSEEEIRKFGMGLRRKGDREELKMPADLHQGPNIFSSLLNAQQLFKQQNIKLDFPQSM